MHARALRAVSRDPREYPDPERFWPDRFLKDGKLNPAVRDPNTYAFGFGRRCVSHPRGSSSPGTLTLTRR